MQLLWKFLIFYVILVSKEKTMDKEKEELLKEQYANFVKSLKSIRAEVRKNFRKEGKIDEFKLSDILYCPNHVNIDIHKKIMNKFTEYGSNEEGLQDFVDFVKGIKAKRTTSKKYADKDIENVIETYTTLYCNKYFVVLSGRAVQTTLCHYNVDDKSEYERKLRASVATSLPLILTKDGEVYFSATCHKDLCGWLTAQNKDLKGAMRIFILPKHHMFTMTSMWNYDYTQNSNKDLHALITPIQAEIFCKLYRECGRRWSTINPIEKVVQHSNFFVDTSGTEEAELIVNQNLKTLEDAFGGAEFSIREYKKYLHRQLKEEYYSDYI